MKKTLLMKKLMKKALLTFATLLLVVACSKDDKVNNPTEENNNFPFLKLGNSWTYRNIDTTNEWDGTITIDTTEFTMTLKYKDTIFDINDIGDNTKYSVYLDDYFDEDDNEYRKLLVFVATDSAVSYSDGMFFPLFWKDYTLNKKWIDPNPNDDISREIISINETVEVEAGTFYNCIKIEEKDHENENSWCIWWIRNDIGIIKWESKYDQTELKSKNLN